MAKASFPDSLEACRKSVSDKLPRGFCNGKNPVLSFIWEPLNIQSESSRKGFFRQIKQKTQGILCVFPRLFVKAIPYNCGMQMTLSLFRWAKLKTQTILFCIVEYFNEVRRNKGKSDACLELCGVA